MCICVTFTNSWWHLDSWAPQRSSFNCCIERNMGLEDGRGVNAWCYPTLMCQNSTKWLHIPHVETRCVHVYYIIYFRLVFWSPKEKLRQLKIKWRPYWHNLNIQIQWRNDLKGLPFRTYLYVPEEHPETQEVFYEWEDDAHLLKVIVYIPLHILSCNFSLCRE